VYAKDGLAQEQKPEVAPAGKCYFFNAEKKKVKVYADDICYIESLKDYVGIHSKDRKIITKFQIGEIDRLLEEDLFMRIHRSFIVNVSKVTAYSATEIELGDISLPLGRTYKEMVERRLRE
jgi:DNA-binding LytR/AlgR family response regulator